MYRHVCVTILRYLFVLDARDPNVAHVHVDFLAIPSRILDM